MLRTRSVLLLHTRRRFYSEAMAPSELSALVGVDESRRPRSIFFYDGG